MRKASLVLALAFCINALIAGSGCGQAAAPAVAEKKPETAEGTPPKPEDVLRQMTDYLGTLPAFSCRVESEIHVQAQGMDNRSVTKVMVRLERPNKLSLAVDAGGREMNVVSDGKKLIQYIGSINRYVVSDAPADFAALTNSEDSAGVALMGIPKAMIPTNGEEFYKALTAGVTGSEYLGTEKIGEVLCHHCRFVQQDMDWEIWIEVGDRPLVHQVVPDLSKRFGGAEGQLKDVKLEYVASFLDWNVAPKFTDADFAFEPPADAEEVDSLFEALAGGREEGPHPILGKPAPPFETIGPDDEAIDLNAHLGKNVIMLDFWATRCGPCVQAMPQVDAVAKKYADRGLVFYAVNVGEDAETVKEFLAASELEVPVAMDPEGQVAGDYRAEGIPQTVLIGKDGKVQVVHVGFSPNLGELLSAEVEDLLAGKDLASEVLAKGEKAKKKGAAGKASSTPDNESPADGKAATGEETVE